MRPNLLHPLRERSHERSERRGHERHATQRRSEPRVIVLDVEPSVTAGLADDERRSSRVFMTVPHETDLVGRDCMLQSFFHRF